MGFRAIAHATARAALLFLYKEVLRRPLSGLGAIPCARAPVRLPVVLTAEEVRSVLERMRGVTRLVGLLLSRGVAALWKRDAADGVSDAPREGHRRRPG